MILSEEEEVISQHKIHIDDTVELVKMEMMMVQEVDKPKSDIDEYLHQLEDTLNYKLNLINSLKDRVINFKTHLI